jgi:hypothetical protein
VYKYPEKFILLLDRTLSVNCQGWPQQFSDYEEVLAIFRPTVFRDPLPGKMYKTVRKAHHYHLLSDSKSASEVHTHPRTKKVFCVPWDMSAKVEVLPQEVAPLPWADRPLDILFYIPNPSSDPILRRHQEHMEATVRGVGQQHGLRVVTESQTSDLPTHLNQCKIVVSPFGRSEVTSLDTRAVLAQCVLVKPECRYVRGYPDLMTDATVTFCDLDLRNLPAVLTGVLKDPSEALTKAKIARQMLLDCGEASYIENFQKNLICVWDQQDVD